MVHAMTSDFSLFAPGEVQRLIQTEARPALLVKYDAACKAIAELTTIDAAKELRDKATAMKVYAAQANNKQLEADAVEIRMRATRRLGEMTKAQKETVGLSAGTRGSRVKGARVDDKPTLASQGIDKNLANEARTWAEMTEEKFEQEVAIKTEAVKSKKRKRTKKTKVEPASIGQFNKIVLEVMFKALRQLEKKLFLRLCGEVRDTIDRLEKGVP
jgi:hypothetical protein